MQAMVTRLTARTPRTRGPAVTSALPGPIVETSFSRRERVSPGAQTRRWLQLGSTTLGVDLSNTTQPLREQIRTDLR